MHSTSNEATITPEIEGLRIACLLTREVAGLLRSSALVPVLASYETGDLPIHVLLQVGRGATQRGHVFTTWWWKTCVAIQP